MIKSNDLYQSQHNYETGIRVTEALKSVDARRFDRISVLAFCGIVELKGVVTNYYDRALAIRIARCVTGVSTVVESLQIRGGGLTALIGSRRLMRPNAPRFLVKFNKPLARFNASSG